MSLANIRKAPLVAEVDDDLDRILGDTALFKVRDSARILRMSEPTLYRAMRLGRIEYVWLGGRRAITRKTMRRLLQNGVGAIAGAVRK
jgi:hypothetical protein